MTVFAANSPLQISIYGDKDPLSNLIPVAHAMTGLGPSLSEVLVVISPEVMGHLNEAGWSRRQVQEFLYQRARLPARDWIAWGRVDHPETTDDLERLVGCVTEPSRITVVAGGGGAGAFVDVITSWGSSRSVTRKIDLAR